LFRKRRERREEETRKKEEIENTSLDLDKQR
jgi:hypothetical protein